MKGSSLSLGKTSYNLSEPFMPDEKLQKIRFSGVLLKYLLREYLENDFLINSNISVLYFARCYGEINRSP